MIPAYIVERRREQEAAAALPPEGPDFRAAFVACERIEAAWRLPPFRDFPSDPAAPAERHARLGLGVLYLEGLAAAIQASPAWMVRWSNGGGPGSSEQWGFPARPGCV